MIKLFSTRQKEARGEIPDVLTYGVLPNPLRIQIVHILNDAVGYDSIGISQHKHFLFTMIRDTLLREHAVFKLIEHPENPIHEVLNYLLQLKDADRVIDVVELAFSQIINFGDFPNYTDYSKPKITPKEATEELNFRFKQHSMGYQFESNKIIRVDSYFTHSEIIKPALQLLQSKVYKGANEEFLRAHEHYRHNRYHECLVDALKAFESILKIICNTNGWTYETSDSTKKLLDIIFQKELLPGFMQSQFSAMRAILESGTIVVRNKLGGHGQGSEQLNVPPYWARYALNTAASNILLLVEAADERKC